MLKSGESGGSEGNDGEVGKLDPPGTPRRVMRDLYRHDCEQISHGGMLAFVLLRVPKAMVNCPPELSAL